MKRGLIYWNKNEIPQQEFSARITRVRNLMASKNLDAVAIYGDASQSSSLSYLSNFIPYADTGIFILPFSGTPRLFTTHAYRNMPWFRTITWVEDIVCTNSIGEECVKYLKSIDLPEKGIGLVQTRAFPYSVFKLFQNQLGYELVDITDDFEYLRSIKSEKEMRFVSKAADIAVESLKSASKIFKPGLSGYEMAAEIELSARSQGAEDLFCFIHPDDSLSGMTLPSSQKINQYCSIEICVEYNSYWAKVGRKIFTSESSKTADEKSKNFSMLYRGAIENLCPGQSPKKFLQRIKEQLKKIEGMQKISVYFDLGLEPYWATHLNNTTKIAKPFEKNMVLYLKVNIIFEDNFFLSHTDTYILQDSKPLLLTDF